MNIKKLSILLAITTIFTQTAFAAQPSQAVIDDMLKYNIVEIAEDLRLDDCLTRAEASVLICKMFGLSDADVEEWDGPDAVYFNDVPETHWAYKYISMLYGDVFNGDEYGNFNPEENLTFHQLCKILVTAIGYDVEAQAVGGYPRGYVAWAETLGIIDELTDFRLFGYTEEARNLTRFEAFEMIYNSLDIPHIKHVTHYEQDGSAMIRINILDGKKHRLETLRTNLEK